ncbi:MAG: dTDP-4-dehydrorhamnose 3,5-epimerase [Gammaproteobacteria bacterium]|nr:dTDP-4-dehydrorhamnose 3,5-epimerase [Gammaproteobacteria bacterium]
MRFTETELPGAFIIDIQPLEDERGFFARGFCERELAEHGLIPRVVQANISFNRRKGTLRGMHYQVAPHEEAKLVRCTRGALYDVIVDLRPESPTYLQWTGVELTADNHRALFVPQGFAHGFQTLQDNTEAFYQVSEFYTPTAERGLRHDDPAIGIHWPLAVASISAKDTAWPDVQVPQRVARA